MRRVVEEYARTDGAENVVRVSGLHESMRHLNLSLSQRFCVSHESVFVSRVPAKYTGVTYNEEACDALWARIEA